MADPPAGVSEVDGSSAVDVPTDGSDGGAPTAPLLCPECDVTLVGVRSLLRHRRDQHGEQIIVHECSRCDFASKNSQELTIHSVDIHGTVSPPPSSYLEKTMEEGSQNTIEESEDTAIFAVEEDPLSIDSGHIQSEPFAEQVLTSTTAATNTSQSVHKKVYKCTQCPYTSGIYPRFKKHVKYHSMPLIKCEVCEFRTPYRWNLDRHMRNHDEEGRFQCDRCSFAANIKQSLTVHMQNHHLSPAVIIQRHKDKGNRGGSEVLPMFEDLEDADEECHAEVVEDDVVDAEIDRSTLEAADVDDFGTMEIDTSVVSHSVFSVSDAGGTRISTGNSSEKPSAGDNFGCSICKYRAEHEKDLLQHEYSHHGVVRNGAVPPLFIPSTVLTISETADQTQNKAPATTGQIKPSKTEKCPAKRPPPCLIPLNNHSQQGPDASGMNAVIASAALLTSKNGITSSAGKEAGSVLDRLFTKKMAASAVDLLTTNGSPELEVIPKPTVNLLTSSTRCPFCRHRCKTTDDLRTHKRTCPQAPEVVGGTLVAPAIKVSAWNQSQPCDDEIQILDETCPVSTKRSRDAVFTTPSPRTNGNGSRTRAVVAREEPHNLSDSSPRSARKLVKRRVFKCPHCTFWATTASRFHVHLVGHMNQRPYECSECSYRSNWRWDITKHIRIKSSRDQTHQNAELIIKDEGSIRDYDKYDSYLQVMAVEEGLQCKPQETLSSKKVRLTPSPSRSNRPVTSAAVGSSPPAGVPSAGPANVLYGSGLGMVPVPHSSPPSVLIPPRLTPAPPYRQPPMAALRLPLVQSVRIPGMPPGSVSLTTRPVNSTLQLIQPSQIMLQVRPPPAAAHTPSLESLKRMDPALAAMGLTSENTAIILPEPPPDVQEPKANKVTVWRCKKCPYKHKDKRSMLAHVATHSNVEKFNCGHCGKPSNWESVLKRHCRSKHGGVVSIVENRSQSYSAVDGSRSKHRLTKPSKSPRPPGSLVCHICSYSCSGGRQEFSMHMMQHSPQPGANFKCHICPFYVTTTKELLEHLSIHGPNPSANESKFKSADRLEFEWFCDPQPQDQSKPFRCIHCAFSTDQKTQMLSHRQFHALRGLVYQCPCCSYNVTQQSQLLAHVGLHGLRPRAPPTAEDAPSVAGRQLAAEGADSSPQSPPMLSDAETKHMPDVPLVWVSRSGRFYKMHKCRHCPHVNVKKSNIQEHERLHSERDTSFNHHCSKCDYVCVSAGVLTGHMKVHDFSLGKVHAVVNQRLSDEQQLRMILGRQDVSNVEVVVGGDKQFRAAATAAATTAPQISPSKRPSPPGSVETLSERMLFFCQHCPARFFHENEITIHARFHGMNLPYGCDQCNYTARQQPHLLAHLKVHADEYQSRTRSLLGIYGSSPRYPPRSALAPARKSPPQAGDATSSASASPPQQQSARSSLPPPSPGTSISSRGSSAKTVLKRFPCTRCPARFVKEATLRYHMTLHGSGHTFRCEFCDYAVKTYGNLAQHVHIHNRSVQDESDNCVSPRDAADANTFSPRSSVQDFPMSGVDLLKRKLDYEKDHTGSLNDACMPSPKVMRFAPPGMDPNDPYVKERTGNPDFDYPTVTDKMGRERARRYKCRVCPSAFEKRDQYLKHLSLHGAANRFKCTICDYSVRFYANFCAHMKCHGIPPPSMEAARNESAARPDIGPAPLDPAPDNVLQSVGSTLPGPDAGSPAAAIRPPAYDGPPELTNAEKQHLVLQRLRQDKDLNKDDASDAARRLHRCELCPYSNVRRDTTENHRWRHRTYGGHGGLICPFCDYVAHQSHILREHRKMHFRQGKYTRADSFTQLLQLEIFMKEVADRDENEEEGRVWFEEVDTSSHDVLLAADACSVAAAAADEDGEDAAVLIDVGTGYYSSEVAAPPAVEKTGSVDATAQSPVSDAPESSPADERTAAAQQLDQQLVDGCDADTLQMQGAAAAADSSAAMETAVTAVSVAAV